MYDGNCFPKLFPDFTLTATLAQYTDRNRTWSSSGALENRDVLLDILSDAMVLAPLTQLAEIQSEVNENTYFYVFTHRSTFSEYDVVKSILNDIRNYLTILFLYYLQYYLFIIL